MSTRALVAAVALASLALAPFGHGKSTLEQTIVGGDPDEAFQ